MTDLTFWLGIFLGFLLSELTSGLALRWRLLIVPAAALGYATFALLALKWIKS